MASLFLWHLQIIIPFSGVINDIHSMYCTWYHWILKMNLWHSENDSCQKSSYESMYPVVVPDEYTQGAI